MKLKIAAGIGFLAGAAAVVAAVVLLAGKPAVPAADANAAEPNKLDDPAKGAEPGQGANYNWQYESTKPRTIVEKASGKYYGEASDYKEVSGEYDVLVFASRTRGSGRETHLVWLRKQWVKAEGADGKKLVNAYSDSAVSAADAASAVAFINRLKDVKKSKSEEVNYAWIKWVGEFRDVYGRTYEGGRFEITSGSAGEFTMPNGVGFFTYHPMKPDEFAKLLSEGLKELDELKKAEWSPTP